MQLPKAIFTLVLFAACAVSCLAQGTMFTYQGRLNQLGIPANGSYDFEFALYDTNGNQVSPFITNSAVSVNNGLFAVSLDFGGIFTGSNYWLQIATRTNGATAFTMMNPRQPVTPTPYAIMANSASNLLSPLPATRLVGVVPVSNLPVNYTNMLVVSNLPAQFALNVLTAGVTNDGVTDVTSALQGLLNRGGVFYFPAGRYLAQELHVTNNTTLIGSGATLVYAKNAANSNIFVSCGLNTNISILTLAFDGGNYSDISTRTYNTYAGVQNFSDPQQFAYFNPMGLRHGLQFNTEAGGLISGITIYGFSGIGLLPVSMTGIGGAATVKSIVTGVNCYSNFVGFFSSGYVGIGNGIYLPNWINNYVPGGMDPEFMFYSGLNLFHNTIGMSASAGNCTYVNSAINGNYFGQLDTAGNNEHHGSINSVEYTHNTVLAIWISSCRNGEQIINCELRDNGGSICLDGCQGVTIDNCTFAPLVVTNKISTDSGENFFRHNSYQGTWATQTFNSNGRMLYFGNNSTDNPGDNDGQPLTLLATMTNAGLTTNMQGTFNGTNTSTLHFTNGILVNVTQP